MNTNLNATEILATIKYYSKKLDELKFNFCEDTRKARLQKLIELYTEQYIIKTDELPA